MQTQTKFDSFKKFLCRKKTFRFRDVEKAYGFPSTETTYLNTLRRAGLVEQVERGHYKVPDIASLKAVSLSNLNLSLKVEKLQVENELLQNKLNHNRKELTRNEESIKAQSKRIGDLEAIVEIKEAAHRDRRLELDALEETGRKRNLFVKELEQELTQAKQNNRTLESRVMERNETIAIQKKWNGRLIKAVLVLTVGLVVAVIL